MAKYLAEMSVLARFITLTLGALVVVAQPARAQPVNTCEAITLYGNAANQGLCKSLSPGTQNHWVCDLTAGNPDIHLTFNANTP
jgi:hypothetical protein